MGWIRNAVYVAGALTILAGAAVELDRYLSIGQETHTPDLPTRRQLPSKLQEAVNKIEATYKSMGQMRASTNSAIDKAFDVDEPEAQYTQLKKEVEADAEQYQTDLNEFADPKNPEGLAKEARKRLGLDK